MDGLIDLHIHTNKSDGEFSPIEILNFAKENNVKYLSLTDHDSLDAYTEDVFKKAKELEINLITGVEISTKIDKCGIHVLGYNVDINNVALNEMLYKIRNARHIYLHDVGKRLIEIGYKIDIDELDKIDVVTKAHISSQIVSNKENEEKLLEYFGYIPNRGEFIEAIMNEGCIAYVSKYVPTLTEIYEVVKNAGGKVYLAHPVAYIHIDNLAKEDIQNIVNELKPDGIETNYILVNKENEKIDEIDRWNEFANKNNLFVSIGSDFHRFGNNHPVVGLVGENIKISNEEKEMIIRNILS